MDATEEFLAALMPRLTEAEIALHCGDPAQRTAMWSRADPVTLFGAATTVQGCEEISPVFSWLGEAFADLQAYRMEVLAAGSQRRPGLPRGARARHLLDERGTAAARHTTRHDHLRREDGPVAGGAPARRPALGAVRR